MKESQIIEKGHNIKVYVTLSCDCTDSYMFKNKFPQGTHTKPNLNTVCRSNKAVQALSLPTVININPRSLNNKVESFKTYMKEENVNLAFVSESHEREGHPLVDSLQLNSFEIVSSVHQRREKEEGLH